jgi:hypothetical protein
MAVIPERDIRRMGKGTKERCCATCQYAHERWWSGRWECTNRIQGAAYVVARGAVCRNWQQCTRTPDMR